MMTLNG